MLYLLTAKHYMSCQKGSAIPHVNTCIQQITSCKYHKERTLLCIYTVYIQKILDT